MHHVMFGAICVWLALAGSLSAAVLYVLVARGREELRPWARLSYVMVAQGIIWAAFHLMYLVLHHRYDVAYVAEYSDSSLRTFYLVSSFWAGQQGTFFLWAIYGCILGVIFMTRCRRSFEAPAMVVIALIQFFLSSLLAAKSPFELTPVGQIPPDGQGLNVLLQNHWMVIHPPIMFLGFSSLAIPFAIGIAALVRKEYDGWIQVAWPWILFAWCTLGTGLFMGGYWAYTVLGWGGFWGWDNVENSSLIPWIATTALLHGIILQWHRGSMKRANILMAVTPYLLVLYGSFLTRSGILADFSVHSFAAPARIIYIVLLGFVGVFYTGAIVLLIARVRSIPSAEPVGDELTRAFFFVIGSWVLYAIAYYVVIGTSWPLLTGLIGKPANVTQAFYNKGLFPVAILLCIAMGITPFLKWRGKPAQATSRMLGACAAGAVILGLGLTLCNARFFAESMQAPVDALVRSNPSVYAAPSSPRPSGVLLNGRTSAQGAVTTGRTISADDQTFLVPAIPHNSAEAYAGALRINHGWAYPIFAVAALFCILANGLMFYRITGINKRSWLPAGGFVTHMGLGILLIGVITSMNYGGDAVLNLDTGDAHTSTANAIVFTNPVPVKAFGHTFAFQGFGLSNDARRANMNVAVTTGDETLIEHPSLTMAKDGNVVHFPSIKKYWLEDLYLSPLKLPGQADDSNRRFKFHVKLAVTRDGKTETIQPGIAFAMAGGPQPTDTPLLPGTDYQVAIQTMETPTQDAPDRKTAVVLSIQQEGKFNKSGGGSVLHLEKGQSAAFQGCQIRFVSFSVDQRNAEEVAAEKESARIAQVQVSTKPLINLVWLGTFLIIGGGLLALVRRSLLVSGREDRSSE